MATIKKAYQAIVSTLEENATATVADVLPLIIELASAKTGSGGGKASNFHKDENGVVVAIKCYYHKLWMDPREVDFGQKQNSPSGFNSMCKDGVSKWTKQKAEAKKAEAGLLQLVASGELDPSDIPAEIEAITETAARIEPREDGYGFATLEECLEAHA